ncbi:hypothetical protein LMJ38_35165 [Streptomyces sp. R1]|uniref:hypothetical protein n=1 Tax=Streptomyces sp. R1 TaxID=1509279 RepID=UPI001E4C930E|nr:hypothetical protein [Streptomyces sp. R1]MCC8341132.1 hypothetical protein [Streptomyces sp. R1]
MDMVRPCAVLSTRDDGPVAARFGGPVLLPVGTPHPPFPYVASIDLAALPQASTDLLCRTTAAYSSSPGRAVSENVEDWVLLASWSPGLGDVPAGSSVHWAIQRKDLEAGRFDRTFTDVYWNP